MAFKAKVLLSRVGLLMACALIAMWPRRPGAPRTMRLPPEASQTR
jgi:hypothetical protein